MIFAQTRIQKLRDQREPKRVTPRKAHNWFHAGLMVCTALMVVFTNVLAGVLSAMVA